MVEIETAVKGKSFIIDNWDLSAYVAQQEIPEDVYLLDPILVVSLRLTILVRSSQPPSKHQIVFYGC